MSPRAACRLEQLGFTDVYDYVPGKSDWLAANLPREGRAARIPLAGDVIDAGVPRCGRRESAAETLRRLRADGHGLCAVVSDDGVVLGTFQAREEEPPSDERTVEDAMRPGPTTVRASEPVEPLVERMRRAGVERILVTDPEGRLLGMLDRRHAEEGLRDASDAG